MGDHDNLIDTYMSIFNEWIYFNTPDKIEKIYKNGIKIINGKIFIIQIYCFHKLYRVCLFDMSHNTHYITYYIDEYNMENYMCFIAKYCYICAVLYDIFLIFIGGIDSIKTYTLQRLNEILDCVLRYDISCIEDNIFNDIKKILCDEDWLTNN